MVRIRRCRAQTPERPTVCNGYERELLYVYGAVSPTPEAGLVLEHQADPAALDLLGVEEGCQNIGEFFFHCSCVSGSLLGCRVSGATLRQP